ncbi:hypothetical protein D3C85_1546270 [compost metagenome]
MPSCRQQGLIVIAHFGTNHHLELPGVGEATFDHRQFLDGLRIGFGRIVQHKTQTGNAVADGGDIFAAPNQNDQLVDISLFNFAHHEAS